MAQVAYDHDFSTNTSEDEITDLFVYPGFVEFDNLVAADAGYLTIPSFHLTALLSGDTGGVLQLIVTNAAGNTGNGTVVFSTAATYVQGGGVARNYEDHQGITVPATGRLFVKLPNGNVSGGIAIHGDFEFEIKT
jgi:hypothetical protein